MYSEDDFYVILENSMFSPDDALSTFYHFPAFCGELPADSTESIFDVCKREIVLFLTYTLRAEKTEGVCDDLSDYTACYS